MSVTPPPLVLVVDDHNDTRNIFRFALDISGIESEGAATGAEALQKVAERVFDAIVLDIGLPDFDGYEVARRVRQNPATKAIPIIAVTGWTSAAYVQRAYDAGCSSVLVKPCEFPTLLKEIQRHLPLHFPPAG